MRYNLEDSYQATAAFMLLSELINKKVIVDIKEIKPKRSLKQNSYLHLILGIFALETGYTLQESKTLYKRVNAHLYSYEKNNQQFLRSSTELSEPEMSRSIEIFRAYASEHDINLPLPNDDVALMYWQNEIEKRGKYV